MTTNAHVVSYDLHKQGQNYTDLIAKLKTYAAHWHVQQSVWIIGTTKSAAEVRDDLKAALDANDKLIVARLQGEAAWYGYGANIDDWLKAQLQKAA
jgi:hypothetical protein